MPTSSYSILNLLIHFREPKNLLKRSVTKNHGVIWSFPKIRGTILAVPIMNKDCSMRGSMLRSPYLGKLPHDEPNGKIRKQGSDFEPPKPPCKGLRRWCLAVEDAIEILAAVKGCRFTP